MRQLLERGGLPRCQTWCARDSSRRWADDDDFRAPTAIDGCTQCCHKVAQKNGRSIDNLRTPTLHLCWINPVFQTHHTYTYVAGVFAREQACAVEQCLEDLTIGCEANRKWQTQFAEPERKRL